MSNADCSTSTPLLNLTAWTFEILRAEVLEKFGCRPESRPEQFQHHATNAAGRPMQIESTGFVSGAGNLNIRTTRVQSPSADVATVMIYPLVTPHLLPVFAAEWVVLGSRVHVAVLDAEFVATAESGQDRVQHASFAELGERWRGRLPENREKPAWFQEIESPWSLYSTGPVELLAELKSAYRDYLEASCRLYAQAIEGTSVDPPEIAAYKKHHAAHSPAFPMMEPRFGPSWTSTFINDYHFGPVRTIRP